MLISYLRRFMAELGYKLKGWVRIDYILSRPLE